MRLEITWGNAALLMQDLDKSAGLTTFPQDNNDYDDGLSIMRAIQTHRPTLLYASTFNPTQPRPLCYFFYPGIHTCGP